MFNIDEISDRESDFVLKNAEMVAFQPNHGLMAKPKLREQDLNPERIFFYKRIDLEDGDPNQIVVFMEGEAARIMKSSHRHLYRQIGYSNGQAYSAYIRSKGLKAGQLIPKTEAEQILREAFMAEVESAKGHYDHPLDQNVHFDNSFPLNQRNSFVPPA